MNVKQIIKKYIPIIDNDVFNNTMTDADKEALTN